MSLPDRKFEIKLLGGGDISLAETLARLFEEVFEKENTALPDQNYLRDLLSKPGFLVYVALHEDNVVGGLTAFQLPMIYSKVPELFIYDIAIKAEYQRQGIGRKLLSTVEEYCRDKGINQIFVDASESDEHALGFYRGTGGVEEKVVQFTYLVR